MYTAYLCQKSSIHTLSFILGPTSSQNLFRSLTTQLFTSSIWQDLQSILMNHGPQEIQDTHHWDHGPFTKHFSYLKWRNPHTCKLYVFQLMDTGKPTPKIWGRKVFPRATWGWKKCFWSLEVFFFARGIFCWRKTFFSRKRQDMVLLIEVIFLFGSCDFL